MIEVEQLAKNYNGARGLAGFSLRVEAGELVGLVGPNGAGKSTLIRILATLIPATSGRAGIGGCEVSRNPLAVRKLIGYQPDVPGLYQDMRVSEFLEFFADAFHLRGNERQAAVAKALEVSGLGERRDAFVEQLSLGQKQRLVLAKVLLHDPKVLLLDEPATGLDPLARIELRERLKALQKLGVTILISSHILSDLEDICTRIAFISEGQNVSAAGSPVEVRPAAAGKNHYVVEFLGDPAPVVAAASRFAGATIVEQGQSVLLMECAGGREQASALLRHLITAGVQVVRFAPGGTDLEDHYRKVFGGKP